MEICNYHECDEAAWCPGFIPRCFVSARGCIPPDALSIVAIRSAAAFDVLHCLKVNPRTAGDPTKPSTHQQHDDNHPTHTEAQESSPGMRDGFGQGGGHSEFYLKGR